MLIPKHWFPGARVERLRHTHSYGFVLGLVLATFIWAAAAPETGWARTGLLLLQGAVLATAAWTAGLGRLALYLAGGLIGIEILVGVIASLATHQVTGGLFLLGAALVAAACVIIGLGVFDQGEVNQQSILGAVSVYVLLGLLFTSIYSSMAELGSNPLFAQGTDGTVPLRLYFSFITLATVGYGDYTMRSDLGHTVAVVEALVGQLYLVTVVATLVGRMRPRAPAS